MMSKKTLYRFAFWTSLAGILWVFLNTINPWEAQTPTICMFQNLCHYPCPACGTTHSVMKLMRLDLAGAIYDNPLGLLATCYLVATPAWLTYDKLRKKESLYRFYCYLEYLMSKKLILLAVAMVLMANWAWNIHKFTA